MTETKHKEHITSEHFGIPADFADRAENYAAWRVQALSEQLAEAQALIEASRQQEPIACIYNGNQYMRHEFMTDKIPEGSTPLYAAPVVAPDVQHANLLKVMKDIVQLWDHHCYEHGDGIPSPLHCRAKEAIAAMGGAV